MTIDDILSLGWKDRHPGNMGKTQTYRYDEEECHYLMSFHVKGENDGTHAIMINYVDKDVTVNEWETSETWFYGHLKAKEDLKNIMRYLSIIDY